MKWGGVSAIGLNPASVNTILASAAQLAGLDYAPELSRHSLWRGHQRAPRRRQLP
ncbi:hypothetical protein [Duganella sp. CY15W]|uniref:hypothetical protein n=1 Tax=Duganella sp. CY15W TaxID=2692172 RepID=UPI001E508923|nr:hypothetical protein [Duganella sp. CY15W]